MTTEKKQFVTLTYPDGEVIRLPMQKLPPPEQTRKAIELCERASLDALCDLCHDHHGSLPAEIAGMEYTRRMKGLGRLVVSEDGKVDCAPLETATA